MKKLVTIIMFATMLYSTMSIAQPGTYASIEFTSNGWFGFGAWNLVDKSNTVGVFVKGNILIDGSTDVEWINGSGFAFAGGITKNIASSLYAYGGIGFVSVSVTAQAEDYFDVTVTETDAKAVFGLSFDLLGDDKVIGNLGYDTSAGVTFGIGLKL